MSTQNDFHGPHQSHSTHMANTCDLWRRRPSVCVSCTLILSYFMTNIVLNGWHIYDMINLTEVWPKPIGADQFPTCKFGSSITKSKVASSHLGQRPLAGRMTGQSGGTFPNWKEFGKWSSWPTITPHSGFCFKRENPIRCFKSPCSATRGAFALQF